MPGRVQGLRNFPFLATTQWLIALRVLLGAYMTAHGVARIMLDTVDAFGEFLASRGLPVGSVVAWGVTLFEVTAGPALSLGWIVRPLAAAFVLEHLTGIALVHAPRGWFTVGHQVGGAEYSVLLVVCFLLVASAHQRRT